MSAKFHGLVLFGLQVTLFEFKEEEEEGEEEDEELWCLGRIGIFYLTPFPCTNLHVFLVSGVI